MNVDEQKAILTLALMAAFADGGNDESERDALKGIAASLAGEGATSLPAAYQDVLMKRVTRADVARALTSPETRQLAFEMAVCVCDADGVQSPAERAFLDGLRADLGLDAGQAQAFVERAESLAAAASAPAAVASGAVAAASPSIPRAPLSAPGAPSEAEIDQRILSAAIRNGALELLPESLATMAVIPLQMKLVHEIGRAYGYDLERGQLKDLLATLGVGLTSQYVEQVGRKLLGGILGAVGGGLLRGLGKQAVSSGMGFASTYALGHVAKRYYAGGRTLSPEMLKETFQTMLGEAKNLQSRYAGDMQEQARSLDTRQLVDLVRRG
ncbi:MAG: DUF533 domain-containing protein [Deltaproteobacteria bacterium]|nr:DUF533 domain-containing protein [Deltaproteobacteria bacterium]